MIVAADPQPEFRQDLIRASRFQLLWAEEFEERATALASSPAQLGATTSRTVPDATCREILLMSRSRLSEFNESSY
jgi:hypothetical protein